MALYEQKIWLFNTQKMKQYRNNGAIGALLDEYEKALQELHKVLNTVSQQELTTIADPHTKDPDCHSIQTILTHVVCSGYGYATSIRNSLGENNEIIPKKELNTTEDYQKALQTMFAYNEKVFEDYPTIKMSEKETAKKILTSWGQRFDVDQLMEHAIVHVLRHRRQIERFLQKLR